MSATTPAELPPSRRDFLGLAWKTALSLAGLLGLGGLFRYFNYSDEPPAPTEFDLGPAEQYAPGTVTPLPQAEAVLIHDASGFRALSSNCPHLGCTVVPAAQGFACHCHDSQFDAQGALLKGPATRALKVLRVERTSAGRLVLHL